MGEVISVSKGGDGDIGFGNENLWNLSAGICKPLCWYFTKDVWLEAEVNDDNGEFDGFTDNSIQSNCWGTLCTLMLKL